jgi:hypothetical protein
MEHLDYDRVKSRFLSVTGMSPEDFSEGSIFDNAETFVLSRLCIPPDQLTDPQRKLCEYAAAAVAVYDRSVTLCLSDRPVMSETGRVTAQREKQDVIRAAEQLRSEAFGQLAAAGIAKPQGMAFVGV